MPWNQVYDPLGNWVLSTIVAALPIVVLLGTLAFLHTKAHWSALLGLATALLVSILVFGMPMDKAGAVAVYGAAYGLFPIGWIIFNVIFLYTLTNEKGLFQVLQESLTNMTQDRRLQLLLIAFSFGAFFEGAAGFGTPVAVTAAILIGLGFSPLVASGLSLLANTAPVAFGALGTPIVALSGVTGIDATKLSAMVGRQLPFFSILIPFWLMATFAGWRGMIQVWPALLVAGAFFAIPQFLVSNFHGPWLTDVVASVISMFALAVFLFIWRPKQIWQDEVQVAPASHSKAEIVKAWTPWVILSVIVFIWGIPEVKAFLDGISVVKIPVPGVDKLINRLPPVVPSASPETAVFSFNYLSFTGTAILISALLSALVMGLQPSEIARAWWATLKRVRFSLLTVAAMLAIGYTMHYSGLHVTMGLAFAKTGLLYPFFAALLGWLGVALTGSDTSSNVLFGGLQKVSAEQVGVSPVLTASANSSGGVMGKMIDAQSIVVASTATRWYGHEGEILRFVFLHSLALAFLVGVLVFLQAYVFPFTQLVVR
ncbi:MAG: L-lactate permease [Chloroflexi bacterium]|nr:L-lactate permease [Chloroflexota bacterium]